MRITILSSFPNLTGGQRVVAIYAKKLSERGHFVEIVCSKKKVSIKKKIKYFFNGSFYSKTATALQSHYESYGVRYRIVNHYGPLTNIDINHSDVLIATFWPTAFQAYSFGRDKGLPIYLVQHDEGLLHKGADDTYRLPIPQICVSRWISQSIISRHPEANQVVINNAVETEKFLKGQPIIERPLRFGFVYSNRSWKRSDIALKALILSRDKVKSISAISVGTNFSTNIPTWIRKIQNPNTDYLSKAYGSCRAWLFTSDIEGFGLPILESMACGTPVIGTPAGAAPDLISKGGGFLVPFNDYKALSDAIMKICESNNDQLESMSKIAFNTAIDYTWDNATDKLETVLKAYLRSHF